MNGFIRKTMAGLCLTTGFASLTGCYCYRQLVDPCWPERYNYQARMSVYGTFDAQAANGHVLDQTVWSHMFDVDTDPKTKNTILTDRLNPAGQEHLHYLVRRRPHPDPKIYLQTAQDLPSNLPPEKLAQIRAEIDAKRVAAVRNYLNFLMAGRAEPTEFAVIVHDPATPYLYALPIAGATSPRPQGALADMYQNFKGTAPMMSGGSSSGGGAGGSSGGGGGGAGR